MTHILIIGAGECGARAAFCLREKGFPGEITLVGAEEHLPYERPPLSKDALLLGHEPKLVSDAARASASKSSASASSETSTTS